MRGNMLIQLTVFLELCSRKTVRFSEQIMSAEYYPSIFSHKMEAIVYLISIDINGSISPFSPEF